MKKRKIYNLIGQATVKISIYIICEIAFYKLVIWILDNCFTTG